MVVRGSASFRLTAKLKELKQNLKIWNREVFGSLECNKVAALQQVEYWDRMECERSLTDEELACKKEAKEGYAKWVDLEETHWRQASRELWLKERDRNTVYFHRMASAHRRANYMDRIKINGVRLLGDQKLNQISLQEAGLLKLPFSKAEVQAALMDMNGDKDFVKEEILDMGEKGLICKLDIEKAYDMVELDVVLHLHSQVLSLGERSSSWLLLKFEGLRQGDPLSPYLFVMGMEVLSVLIKRAVEGGFILGCNIRHEVDEMAVELGCRVGQLPAVYLGLPLGAPNKAISVWDGVEERVRRRLALWKRQYISKGGRITLIKSTMTSMQVYQMSLFSIPKSVARRLEKPQRDFLWGGGNLERKAHLVNWEAVCVDKEKGGLGIRKLTLLNKALLGKWIWRFACAKEDLWKQVLMAKYGQEDFGGWMVLGKKWRLKWEKALKSGFGLIFGVRVQCCLKDSRISSLWLLKGMRQ
ncbi:hypothetical protein AAG906_032128 [Vitis piasezkii]